ncbi:MAG: hypothetical protein K2Q22_17390, partial [Cytophagales bacterium]|nr:hypothetical protein [Cytophagales bacterium]
EGKLRITFQYNWWSEGCVERMPRVRFGKLHIVNNLYNSSVSKYCILAGYHADLLIENNAFINVKTPIDITQGTFVGVTARNNIFSGTTGNTLGSGTSFTPHYTLSIANASVLNTSTFKNCVGATLAAPPTLTCPCVTALAVELESFDLVSDDHGQSLRWKLAHPTALDHIDIETSTNGSYFTSLETVSPTSTSFILPSATVGQGEGPIYFRLKLVEKGGITSFSSIKTTTSKQEVYVYPNPAQDLLYYYGWAEAVMAFYTLEGIKVWEQPISHRQHIPIQHLHPGSYVLTLSDRDGNERKRMGFYKY